MSAVKDQVAPKRHTPSCVDTLEDNEIFVFGSNVDGNHAGGAARTAVEKFGAVMGQGEGLQGKSYAIPTMEGLGSLKAAVRRFLDYAECNEDKTFLVTAIGTGIAKHNVEDIASLFAFAPSNVVIPAEFDLYGEPVTTYKGFNNDFVCNPCGGQRVQYEVGQIYAVKGRIKACSNGFHACEYPLNVFEYYPPAGSRYGVVQQAGNLSRHSDDTKVASRVLKVSAEIGLPGLIKTAIEYTMSRVKPIDPTSAAFNSGYQGAAFNSGYQGAAFNSGPRGAASNSGDYGAASNSGDYGAASNSGDYGAASNSGYQGAASNSGDYGAAFNSGDYGAASNVGTRGAAFNSGDYGVASNIGTRGAASNSGDYGAASNSGYQGAASNSGDYGAAFNSSTRGAAFNSGYQGAASNSGYQGAASNSGEHGIAMAHGIGGRVMGSLGTVLFLVERDDEGATLNAWSGIVGRAGVKPDTWYILKNGVLTETTND